MEKIRKNTNFEIRSYLWHASNQRFKTILTSLLMTDQSKASQFCDEYFNKFYLIHKIRHIILHKYDKLHHINSANTEYCASLFAYKYFQYKGENEYLRNLLKCVDSLLHVHNATFNFEIEKMNALYLKYRRDIRTYAAFHFNSLKKCSNENDDLPAVMKKISKGILTQINQGIILRKNLKGIDLINECMGVVFELNEDVPEVFLKYCEDINVEVMDLELV